MNKWNDLCKTTPSYTFTVCAINVVVFILNLPPGRGKTLGCVTWTTAGPLGSGVQLAPQHWWAHARLIHLALLLPQSLFIFPQTIFFTAVNDLLLAHISQGIIHYFSNTNPVTHKTTFSSTKCFLFVKDEWLSLFHGSKKARVESSLQNLSSFIIQGRWSYGQLSGFS